MSFGALQGDMRRDNGQSNAPRTLQFGFRLMF